MTQSLHLGAVVDRVSLTTGLALLRGECGRVVTPMIVVAVDVLLGALLSSELISMIFVAVILLMIIDELGAR